MPVNFTASPMPSPLSSLPLDPVNSLENGQFYIYTAEGGAWKLTSLLESLRHARSMNTDGGPNTSLYEVGSNLNIANFQRGLVGQWSFEDGTGTTVSDTSGRGNTGTLHTGTIPIPNPCPDGHRVPGVIGQAICLDGSDDRVDIPHADIQNTVFGTSTVFTLEAWAFPRDWANWATIMNKATDGWWSNTTNGMWADTGGFGCVMGSNIAANPAGSVIGVYHIPPLNQWHHIVCTADGTNLIMFVNGVEIGRRAISLLTHPRTSNTAPIVIGRRCVGCGPSFNGLIDEVRIYNRALSASEIRANFNAGR